MKNWLVIYDIRDPRRLNRIAKLMKNYGTRVQKSVFEAVADEKTIAELRRKALEKMEFEDYVVYFDICQEDWQKQEKYGPEKYERMEDKSYHIF